MSKKTTFTWLFILSFFIPQWGYCLSEKDLEKVEKEFIYLINQSSHVVHDPLAVEYINHLGRRLAKNSAVKRFYFFIVKSNEINAFAGPGGYIGVNTSLILASSTESELAAVMAHELSHVALEHLKQMIAHQKQMKIPMIASTLAAIALGVINPSLGQGALMASMSGFAQDNINFTRANEKQADRIGINLLYKSGLDPMGMVNFFKKMQQSDQYYYQASVPAILRTHPLDEDRISEALNRISGLHRRNLAVDRNYYLFKEKIRVSSTTAYYKLLKYYQHSMRPGSVATQYGLSLTHLAMGNYKKAKSLLNKLAANDPDNLYYQIPLAQAQMELKQEKQAINRLNDVYLNYPDNYAAIIAYAQTLLHANKPNKAITVLSQAQNQFPTDIYLCEQLARAYSNGKQKGRAYFINSQCLQLQGERHAAMQQLQTAKKISKNNRILQLQIQASIDKLK